MRDDMLKAVIEYEERFRRADLDRLEVSGLYALFPSTENVGMADAGNWRDNAWPNGERAGVYAIFDDDVQLLWIGKASMNSSLGGRLYKYFREDRHNLDCIIRHTGWSPRPAYVMTVAVPRDMPFEAPALEKYLINRLQPRDNTIGVRSCD